MANTLNQQTVADVTRDILVRPLTGQFYPAVIPAEYNNIYEWVRFKVEEAGGAAPTQEDADSSEYLYTNGLLLMKEEVIDVMVNW